MKSKIDMVMESLCFEFDLRPYFNNNSDEVFSFGYSKDEFLISFECTLDNKLQKISYYTDANTFIGFSSAVETLKAITNKLSLNVIHWQFYSDDTEVTIYTKLNEDMIDISNML